MHTATGRVTINQEQFKKLRNIYDETTKDSTSQDLDGISDFDHMMEEGLSGHGCLPEFRVENEEDRGSIHDSQCPQRDMMLSTSEVGAGLHEPQNSKLSFILIYLC